MPDSRYEYVHFNKPTDWRRAARGSGIATPGVQSAVTIPELDLSRVGGPCNSIRRDDGRQLADITETKMILGIFLDGEATIGHWGACKALERGHVLKKERSIGGTILRLCYPTVQKVRINYRQLRADIQRVSRHRKHFTAITLKTLDCL